MMAVAAAQKNREMFAIKKSYSIEVSSLNSVKEGVEKTYYNDVLRCITIERGYFLKSISTNEYRNLSINFGGKKLLAINEFSILASGY